MIWVLLGWLILALTPSGVDIAVWPQSVNVEPGRQVQFYAATLSSDGSVGCDVPPPAPGALYESGSFQGGCDSAIALLSQFPARLPPVTVGPVIETTGFSLVAPAAYDTARIATGLQYYIDRNYQVLQYPPSYDNWLVIRTANDDKAVTVDPFIVFDLGSPTTVAVAYDNRATTLPDWLNSWTTTGDSILVGDLGASPLRIYEQSFSGRVELGGNLSGGASGANSNYIVLIDA